MNTDPNITAKQQASCFGNKFWFLSYPSQQKHDMWADGLPQYTAQQNTCKHAETILDNTQSRKFSGFKRKYAEIRNLKYNYKLIFLGKQMRKNPALFVILIWTLSKLTKSLLRYVSRKEAKPANTAHSRLTQASWYCLV